MGFAICSLRDLLLSIHAFPCLHVRDAIDGLFIKAAVLLLLHFKGSRAPARGFSCHDNCC